MKHFINIVHGRLTAQGAPTAENTRPAGSSTPNGSVMEPLSGPVQNSIKVLLDFLNKRHQRTKINHDGSSYYLSVVNKDAGREIKVDSSLGQMVIDQKSAVLKSGGGFLRWSQPYLPIYSLLTRNHITQLDFLKSVSDLKLDTDVLGFVCEGYKIQVKIHNNSIKEILALVDKKLHTISL